MKYLGGVFFLSAFYHSYLSNVTLLQFIGAFGVSVVFCVVFLRKHRRLIWFRVLCYSVYGTVLLSATLLGRTAGSAESSIKTLFVTWQDLFRTDNPVGIYEIIYNVLLFLPLGFFFSDCGYEKKKAVLFTFLVSLGIETVQMLTGRGVFEICDLVHNTLGGYTGVLFYLLISRIFRRITEVPGFQTEADNGKECGKKPG